MAFAEESIVDVICRSEPVLAVSHFLYDNYPGATLDNPNDNPICGKKMELKYGSKSATATVVDRCEGCSIWDVGKFRFREGRSSVILLMCMRRLKPNAI